MVEVEEFGRRQKTQKTDIMVIKNHAYETVRPRIDHKHTNNLKRIKKEQVCVSRLWAFAQLLDEE